MNSLFKAGIELQNFMNAKGWAFCFFGALAVIRWGEVRMTQDIDLCVLSGFGKEKEYIDTLLAKFKSRVPRPVDFAMKYRVLLMSASNGVSADISLSGLPFEEKMIQQATPFSYSSECSLITCSAEDLVVLKAFADRKKDWIDIEGIVMRQGPSLDTNYIVKELTPLCQLKEKPEIVRKLEDVVQKNQPHHGT